MTNKRGLVGMLEAMREQGRLVDFVIMPDAERKTVTVTLRPRSYEAFVDLDLGPASGELVATEIDASVAYVAFDPGEDPSKR